MASAPLRQPHMSLQAFRAFVEDRPESEHWELIDGAAMMMAPPTVAHQVIATNLQHLLADALNKHAPELIALPRIGLNLGPAVKDYDPEPDVVIIDAEAAERIGERYAGRFYLAAEIVSSSDRPIVESKRAVYKLHESCRCIMTIQQDRFEVRIDRRNATGWTEQTLARADDLIVLDDFGLRCNVADLYRGTPLVPRAPRSR